MDRIGGRKAQLTPSICSGDRDLTFPEPLSTESLLQFSLNRRTLNYHQCNHIAAIEREAMNYLSTSDSLSGSPLDKLMVAATAQDAAFSELRVRSVQDLKFEADGISYQGQIIPMAPGTPTRLFNMIGAPVWYWAKHRAEFQAVALSEHAIRGDFGRRPTLVLRGGSLATIVRGNLFALPNADVLKAVEEGVGAESESLTVVRIGSDLERLDVELVSQAKAVSVRLNDIVQSGLRIVHERFGNRATLVESFFYRLVCSNGMTKRECASRDGIVRTRKLPVDFPNARELQMDQIRRLSQRTWEHLQTQLTELEASSHRPADVSNLITTWLLRARMSIEEIRPKLIAAWEADGAEGTYYGLLNALTNVGTHDQSLSERQRRALISLGGLLAFSSTHLCSKCLSILKGNVTYDDRAA
jgi:Domain of unknown function (DUF932)